MRFLTQILLILSAFMATPVEAQAPAGIRDAIRVRGEIAVCIWPQYFAISFRNPRTGDLEGIDIDLAREFARRLDVRLRLVETDFVRFMDDLEARRCDIAMFGVGITPARAARVAFTSPYLISAAYAVTTRDNARVRRWEDIDQPGRVVAVAAGTFHEPLMRDALRHAELLVVRPPATREAEVQSGRADVFMSDFPYTRRMVLTHAWARIIDPPPGFGLTRYAYAVAKDDPAWLAEVEAFVTAIRRDGTLRAAAERHGLGAIVVE